MPFTVFVKMQKDLSKLPCRMFEPTLVKEPLLMISVNECSCHLTRGAYNLANTSRRRVLRTAQCAKNIIKLWIGGARDEILQQNSQIP